MDKSKLFVPKPIEVITSYVGFAFIVLTVCFSGSIPDARAADTVHYVKNGGNDSASGLSDATAWATIGRVNDLFVSLSAGDNVTVRLQRGSVWTDDETLGKNADASGNPDTVIDFPDNTSLVIEDYGSGSKPKIDIDTYHWRRTNAIYLSDTSLDNLTIKNIQFEGQKYTPIVLRYVNNITIDGIEFEGDGGQDYTVGAKWGIFIQYPNHEEDHGDIIIRNCRIANMGPIIGGDPDNDIRIKPVCDVGDPYALEIDQKWEGTVRIYNNVIHNINADAIQVRASKADIEIYNNDWYNCGEEPVDIKGSHNIKVYHNHFYRTSGFTGKGGIGGSCSGGGSLVAVGANTEIGDAGTCQVDRELCNAEDNEI